jgi:hypothetical protein
MRRTIAVIAIALLLSMGVAPANADWQYTKWGMTPQQVVEASGGKIKRLEKPRQGRPGEIALLEGPYETGNLKFRATFVFRDAEPKPLTMVNLTFLDSEKLTCRGVHEALFAKYGEPMHSTYDPMTRDRHLFWQEKLVNLDIELYRTIGDIFCFVTYRPLVTEENRGL